MAAFWCALSTSIDISTTPNRASISSRLKPFVSLMKRIEKTTIAGVVSMLAARRDLHTRIENGEYQKRPPADVLHRNRDHLADAVVERPLRAGRHGHAVLADTVGVDFAAPVSRKKLLSVVDDRRSLPTCIGKHNRPAQLLAHHDRKPQQDTFPIPRQPHLLDLDAVRLDELGLDSRLDLVILLHRLQAGRRLVTDVGKVRERRLVAALFHQPARRLLERDHAQQKAHGGDNLQHDGDARLVVAGGGQALLAGVVDPVGDGDAEEDEEAVQGDCQHRRRPDSQPADDPADVEQAQPAGRDGLHDGADGHDEAGEHQAEAAAEAIGAVGHEQRAEEAAGLEGGNDVALDIGEVGRGDAKAALERGEGDGAADEAGKTAQTGGEGSLPEIAAEYRVETSSLRACVRLATASLESTQTIYSTDYDMLHYCTYFFAEHKWKDRNGVIECGQIEYIPDDDDDDNTYAARNNLTILHTIQ
ncbi:hypothetical protein T310_6847 [Rasamsonia emersonii CBS 393.64]|uniref:Uncharacterized protein n=1 Tax=Rasamsonia emersonii (strain ATCC 16479 / CBS 393.64 / IMI 116815) TaxID=1408163 RepID=A0A0F4YMY8_RASE3|nr:hypothetical protein T310_6847 [Rasamsonia emersonii CBS 393.64]KKA19196.1 hypothetical protein T310_6847 [Rasamsonia emersonii CBS 393.64]